MKDSCIIIGMGHAAAQLATTLRQQGWEGSITMIADEPMLPYHRPPLSKDFLLDNKNEDQILLRPAAIYERFEIEIRLNTHVKSINAKARSIELENGEQLSYTKLALCTGGRARKLSISGNDLTNVFYLRNIKDAIAIKSSIQSGKKAIIIGGGYIGLETAYALNKMSMEVTILEAESRILNRVTSPEISNFFTQVHKEEGVEIICNKKVVELSGSNQVEAVICEDGSQYAADLVIIGIGILPNVELAEAARIIVENGIVVDEFAQTSDPHIVAAGDCTQHPSHHYNRQHRLESVPNATDQAKSAAASICDQQIPHHNLPWFWSEQYNLKLQIAGIQDGYDQVVIRRNPTIDRCFSAWYFSDGQLIAADCVNDAKAFMVARRLIGDGISVSAEELRDEGLDLKGLVKK